MKPLDGLLVIDLSRYPPGRYATLMLADLGAEVITIEATRGNTAQVELISDDLGAPYLTVNRNKKSIALNLRSEEGRDIFYRLAEKADVVVEAFRPGVVKRLGVDYDSVKKINPRTVYCSITGYGQDGPYAVQPGHDINYIGLGGILDLTGERNASPHIPGSQIGDLGGGFSQAVIGILVALLAREQTGEGQYIDVAMFDGVVNWLWVQAGQYFQEGISPSRGETIFTGAYPCYDVYETKDGRYITLGIAEPWFWETLCRLLGIEQFIPYQNEAGEKRDEIRTSLQEIFRTKTREEWLALLGDANIPFGPVNTVAEVFDDPHVLHRKMLVEQEHPVLGKIKHIGIPIKFSGMSARTGTPAPRYGEHTAQILAELGYNDDGIVKLRQAGAIE